MNLPPPLPPPPPLRQTPVVRSAAGRWRSAVFALMIPLNIVGTAWVWFGRVFFGAGGWMLILLAFVVLAVMGPVLIATSILAWTQPERDDGRQLSPTQAAAHLALWASMAVFGFFVVDVGDVPESEWSAYSKVLGDASATRLSAQISGIAGLAIIASLVVLMAVMIGERRRRIASTH